MPRTRELEPGDSLEQYLGNLVREARAAMDQSEGRKLWTQAHLAERVFVSQTRISEVELGEVPPDRSLAEKIERTLNMRPGSLVDLVKLLERENVRDYAKPFVRRQEEARLIHEFRLTIPALLQTGDYARALLVTGDADPRAIDTYVEQRMERQRILEQDDPPWFAAIVDEAVLLRGTGSSSVMAAQLKVLLEAQEVRTTSIRILPLRSPHVIAGSFTLVTLANGVRGAYTEGFSTGNYTEEFAEVMTYQRVYDRLTASALTAEASTALIYEAMERFK
ncbi:helix-turn-helix transcriptional regulator [Streptomyces sp. NPDC006711]|uniref:helix-turn-helix domain-containing protein n=1 Tax=unclassified Streptomyces TaxID=2593676 RepID=UPI0033CE7A2B